MGEEIATRYSRESVCPVCRSGSKGCSQTASRLQLCRGMPADPSAWKSVINGVDSIGFGHYRAVDDTLRLNGHTPSVGGAKKAEAKQIDWAAKAAEFAGYLTAQAKAALAENLQLPVTALDSIEQLGLTPHGIQQDGEWVPAWTIPMRNASGKVTGISKRFPRNVMIQGEWKNKAVAKYGHPGVFLSQNWRECPGPVDILPEGGSNTIAGGAVGLAVVGRYSNSVGPTEYLAELFRERDASRPIIILGDNDGRPDPNDTGRTLWPGRDGAEKTAADLAGGLNRPVLVAFPPPGHKDLRDWTIDLLSGQAELEDWAAIRATILDHLTATAKPTSAAAGEPERPKSRWPLPVPASQLPDKGPDVDWIWDGCIARKHVTLFSALMKCGKTTLSSHLLRALQHGAPFIGRQTKKCRTLIVSEESQELWGLRRNSLGFDDNLHFLCRPMLAKPTLGDWLEFIGHLKSLTVGKFDLVVLDTLSAFVPWKNENDAAEVQAALTPLNALTEAGLALLLFHHFGKADGSEGRAARGSTALAGAVDILLELRRFKPDDIADRRRVISGYGRFDSIPDEIVIALASDSSGYTAEGDKKAVAAQELVENILSVLPDAEPGISVDDVHAALPEGGRPRRGDVMKTLRGNGCGRLWRSSGSGKPKDPYRFWKAV